MSIINCKVVNIRPKYDNLKEWMEDSNNIYIARKGIDFINKERYPKYDSIWANPFKIGKDGTREQVVEKYEIWIKSRIEKDNNLKDELLKLNGKNLGCWCNPELCHGHILIKLINLYKNEEIDNII